jgi:hypothetical protein
MMGVYLANLAKKEPADWSAADRTWAESNGLISGDSNGLKRYKSAMTREEFAAVLHRYNEKFGK